MKAPSVKVKICEVCWRTDAFTPGKIDHDRATHDAKKYLESNEGDRQFRKELEEAAVALKLI